MRVAGDDGTARVGFLDEVVTVIGEDAGARGRSLVDSSAKGIVFEADCLTSCRRPSVDRRSPKRSLIDVSQSSLSCL